VTGLFNTAVAPIISSQPGPTSTPTSNGGGSYPTTAAGWFQGTWLIYSIIIIIVVVILIGILIYFLVRSCCPKKKYEIESTEDSKVGANDSMLTPKNNPEDVELS